MCSLHHIFLMQYACLTHPILPPVAYFVNSDLMMSGDERGDRLVGFLTHKWPIFRSRIPSQSHLQSRTVFFFFNKMPKFSWQSFLTQNDLSAMRLSCVGVFVRKNKSGFGLWLAARKAGSLQSLILNEGCSERKKSCSVLQNKGAVRLAGTSLLNIYLCFFFSSHSSSTISDFPLSAKKIKCVRALT